MAEIIYYALLVVFTLIFVRNIVNIFIPNYNVYKIISQHKPIISDNVVRLFGIGGLLFAIYVLVWLYSVIF